MRSLTFILILMCGGLMAQSIETKTELFIENNQVICEFDLKNWEEETKNKDAALYDFKNYNIPQVVKDKKLSSWKSNGWTLHVASNNKYQLKKNINDFNVDFSNTSKYLLENEKWLMPTSEVKKEIDLVNGQILSNKKEFKVVENGNANFYLKGFETAKRVILSGSFNNWHHHEIAMVKENGSWKISLELNPGIYEYKFIVDGEWMHDKNNPYTVKNEHATLNSILLIGDKKTFKLNGYSDAKKVLIAGSFNNWNEVSGYMQKTTTGWQLNVSLPPGKHYYKFIVDGNWITDPENKLKQRDNAGNLNSVLIIQ